jgi:hypothetical protein
MKKKNEKTKKNEEKIMNRKREGKEEGRERLEIRGM